MPRPEAGRSELAAEFRRPLRDPILELRRRIDGIDEPPLHRSPALDAFGDRAEYIREIAPHLALVHDTRQPARSRQHCQERCLRKADGRIPVVHEQKLVARQRELVAAAGADAVNRGDEFQPRVGAGVLDRETGLVGELAEVHLPRMARAAQHEDVGAGAEDSFLEAGDDDRVDLGMLEANALDRIGQLDVDAEVVRVQLEPVVGGEPGIFLHVHRQRRDSAIEGQLPVPIFFRGSVERNSRLECAGVDRHLPPSVPVRRGSVKERYCGRLAALAQFSALVFLVAPSGTSNCRQSSVGSLSRQSQSSDRRVERLSTRDCRLVD